jgi:hypothetical protein
MDDLFDIENINTNFAYFIIGIVILLLILIIYSLFNSSSGFVPAISLGMSDKFIAQNEDEENAKFILVTLHGSVKVNKKIVETVMAKLRRIKIAFEESTIRFYVKNKDLRYVKSLIKKSLDSLLNEFCKEIENLTVLCSSTNVENDDEESENEENEDGSEDTLKIKKELILEIRNALGEIINIISIVVEKEENDGNNGSKIFDLASLERAINVLSVLIEVESDFGGFMNTLLIWDDENKKGLDRAFGKVLDDSDKKDILLGVLNGQDSIYINRKMKKSSEGNAGYVEKENERNKRKRMVHNQSNMRYFRPHRE